MEKIINKNHVFQAVMINLSAGLRNNVDYLATG